MLRAKLSTNSSMEIKKLIISVKNPNKKPIISCKKFSIAFIGLFY